MELLERLEATRGKSEEERYQERREKWNEEHNIFSDNLTKKYKHSGVYCIKIDDEIVYIGQSKDMQRRVWDHIKSIKEGTEDNKYKYLHAAEKDNRQIGFDVVEYVKEDKLLEREKHYISKYKPLLNVAVPGGINQEAKEVKYIPETIKEQEQEVRVADLDFEEWWYKKYVEPSERPPLSNSSPLVSEE